MDIIVVGSETYRHDVARSLKADGFSIYKENNIPVSAIQGDVNVYFFKEDVRLVQAWSAPLWILDPSSKDQRLKEEILIRQNSAASLIGHR